MFTVLLLAFLAPPPGEKPQPKDGPPATKKLFAKETWYKDQKGKEQAFVGLLERVAGPGPGEVGFGRFNPYRLVMKTGDKQEIREVYVGGKPELLKPYVGKKVKLIGKAVDMEVEGQEHHEIWPARLELLPPKSGEARARPDVAVPLAARN
jgi:hypothetical protein